METKGILRNFPLQIEETHEEPSAQILQVQVQEEETLQEEHSMQEENPMQEGHPSQEGPLSQEGL